MKKLVGFMEAVKLMKKGKQMTRTNKAFRKEIDYVTLGVSNEVDPQTIAFHKNGKWQRNMEVWYDDILAKDWYILEKMRKK